MVQLKAALEAEWQEPIKGLRVQMKPLSTSVMLGAQRIRVQLIKADPVASQLTGDDWQEGGASEEDILARRIFLMGVAYVAAGAEAWEGLEDETGAALAHPTPDHVRRLLEQEYSLFNHFDTGYIDQAFRLSAEKNVSAPSLNTSSEREADPTAKTPAKASSAAVTASPAL